MHEIVIAMDEDGLIGIENKLPWHITEELEFFRLLTNRQAVIMGRKTYESIGKPLKNRTNMVITNKTSGALRLKVIEELPYVSAETEKEVHSANEDIRKGVTRITLEDAKKYIKAFNDEGKRVCVIGGKSIYEELIPTANILHISTIKGSFKTGTDKDVFLDIDLSDKKLIVERDYGDFIYRKYLKNKEKKC